MNTITYMTSLLTFYLKGEIKSEQNFISLKVPNTILGLIPLGSKKYKFAVNQISSVSTNFRVLPREFLLGLIIAIFGLCILTSSFLVALLMTACGAAIIISSLQTTLTIAMTSGQFKVVSFLIFEKSKAAVAEEEISRMISSRIDDTNTRQQTDRIVDAINNK